MGFWEISTASHIDFPQQSRTIEICDNSDGTISIYSILIDHIAEPYHVKSKNKYTTLELASISRELSYNDPHLNKDNEGLPCDRNVELLLLNPLYLY